MRRKLKILDFDVECLPGGWIGGDFVSKIITAAAWKWIGSRDAVDCMTHYSFDAGQIAERLSELLAEADVVVGHYIRGFDLRLINGNLLREGLPPLAPVMSHDTKLDLIATHGRSLSQRNLAAMIGVRKPKIDVTLHDWEQFNTRAVGFQSRGVDRVKGDVLQNVEMRARLIELGWIGPPRLWDPAGGKTSRYHA